MWKYVGVRGVEVKDRFECWRVQVWEGTRVGGMRVQQGECGRGASARGK